jgi:hypothetical protein
LVGPSAVPAAGNPRARRVAAIARLVALAVLLASFIDTAPSYASAVSTGAHLRGHVASNAGGKAHPIRYSVAFGSGFGTLSEVDYLFTFSERNPLDPGECLALTSAQPFFGGGFCNVGTAPITSRLLTFPAAAGFDLGAFLDGADEGQIYVDGAGASFHLKSLVVTVVQ